MARVGTEILAADYNSIRTKVVSILGTGVGDRGYGQSILSTPLEIGNEITAAQWNALRIDLINIRLHQEGAIPAIASASQGSTIEFKANRPNPGFNDIIDLATTTRFNIASTRFVISPVGSKTYTQIWKEKATATLTVVFDNSNDARYFFNSGGKIKFSSTFEKLTNTQQNIAWENLLNNAGIFEFGAGIPNQPSFYSLTNTDQIILQKFPEGPYDVGNSSYRIEARCNVANNSTGTANEITFTISWIDDYVDPDGPVNLFGPPDEINGTLTLIVDEFKAFGDMLPEGTTFSITSPTYSLSEITAD